MHVPGWGLEDPSQAGINALPPHDPPPCAPPPLPPYESSPQGGIELAAALRSNATLKTLCLRACALHDEGVAAICSALGDGGALEVLDMSDNGVGWAPLPRLARGLRHNGGRLKSLKLEGWVDAFQEVRGLRPKCGKMGMLYVIVVLAYACVRMCGCVSLCASVCARACVCACFGMWV